MLGVKGRRGSDSPKKGRVPMSERFLNPTPITQYNPVTNEVVKESGKEKPDVVVVNEKLDVVNENPDVVKEKLDFVKENPASVKEKPVVVNEALRYSHKVDKEAVVKNKLSLGKSNVLTKLHKDKDLFKKDQALNAVSKDKPKGNASSELPNKKEKADIPKGKHKVHSEVLVLRYKPTPEVKEKASVCKRILSKKDHSKKKPEVDYDSSSDEKVKKESEEECVSRKGKNKEKQLTSEEAAYQEYLSTFPSFHARTTHVSLFSAIRNSSVDMLRFLNDIGFSSLNNASIDKLPMKLGWFVVSRFKNYKLSLDTGDQIEVTRSKIHDMLGIPVGGYSLFKLDERETGDEFVKEWADQFSPIALKKIRVNDIARKLVESQEIDFLFKVNFLTLFTNTMCKADGLKGEICLDVVKRVREDTVISDIDWCGYVYDCLRDSKLPKGTNNYLGPLTFLILLYLDSTNFERFPVVRTRPAVKNWTSYLMRQRQELELKKRVVGLLDLNSDWTETEVKEAEGFIGSVENSEKEDLFKRAEEKLASICSERVRLEDLLRKANSDYHGDGKFVELQEKYVQVFKDPISFDVGMNSVDGDDGDGNGDDDGTRDDDARGDSDVNRDDDNADSRNDDDVGGDGNGNEDDAGNGDDEDGGCKSIEKQVDATTKEVDATTKEVDATTKEVDATTKEVDATTKENVVEESDEITCTPESFSQWIDANSDFVLEQIDCVVDEYLYGDALDAVAEDMRRNNEGTITPKILVTRHSKASPSPNKLMVKPSSYILSPYMNKKTKVLPKINRTEFMIGASLFAMQRDKIETVFETTSGEEKVLGIRLNMETLSPGLCIDANVVDCWAEILNYEDRFRNDGSLSRHFFPTGCIAFFPMRLSKHFYVVVFSITDRTSMTILDNMESGSTYDSKYKQACELLVKSLVIQTESLVIQEESLLILITPEGVSKTSHEIQTDSHKIQTKSHEILLVI
ncbi:hypothetical protein Tco_0546129, partial [Tanacetum coccineum]